MTTLSEMRESLRFLLDDMWVDNASRWTEARLTHEINVARIRLVQTLAKSGYDRLWQKEEVVLTNGVGTLPEYSRLVSVATESEGATTHLYPTSMHADRSLTSYGQNLQVIYIGKSDPITNDGYTITYGGIDLQDPLIDEICTYVAAMQAKSAEGKDNTTLWRNYNGMLQAVSGGKTPVVEATTRQNRRSRITPKLAYCLMPNNEIHVFDV